MEFQRVKEGTSVTGRPIIDFKTSDYAYRLILDCQKDIYIPYKIMHMDRKEKVCPHCHQGSLLQPHCLQLEKELDSLFLQLIQQPSVRLLWLYREYRSKDETFNGSHRNRLIVGIL